MSRRCGPRASKPERFAGSDLVFAFSALSLPETRFLLYRLKLRWASFHSALGVDVIRRHQRGLHDLRIAVLGRPSRDGETTDELTIPLAQGSSYRG